MTTASKDDKDMTTSRTLWFWLIYNWKTRKKKLFVRDAIHDEHNEYEEMLRSLKKDDPNEHLYYCELSIPPGIGAATLAEDPPTERVDIQARFVREEDDTKRELAKGQTVAHYIARSIFGINHNILPPEAYGPPPLAPLQSSCMAKPDETDPKVYMKVGNRAWKITVEELTEDEVKREWPTPKK